MTEFNALERIRELCTERKWSYYHLSKASGITYSTLKYSLQGTTQGNGLTGGLPPVRFSM